MDKYDLKNCCETKENWFKSINRRYVIFIDGKNRESDRFLKKYNIKSFRIEDIKIYTPNDNYLFIFSSVNKKEFEQFIEAMHDLDISMPILGYVDYEKICKEIFDAALK